MKSLIASIITASLLAFTCNAFAAHPLSTDDAGTQGMLKFQVEATGEFSWDKDSTDGVTTKTNQQNLGLTFTAGLLDSLDASIAFPFMLQQITQDSTTIRDNSGLTDITLALKWRFIELGPVSLAIKPSVTVPNGDQGRGLGNGRAIYSATLISTVDLKPVAIHANLGYTHQDYVDAVRPENRTDLWKMSLAATVELMQGLQVVAEMGTSTNTLHSSNVWPSFVTGGIIYSLTDKLDLDVGVRGGFNKPSTDLMLLAGATFRFP